MDTAAKGRVKKRQFGVSMISYVIFNEGSSCPTYDVGLRENTVVGLLQGNHIMGLCGAHGRGLTLENKQLRVLQKYGSTRIALEVLLVW